MRIGHILQLCFFVGFLAAGSTLTLFVRMTSTDSETENRTLASFPVMSIDNVMSGAFFRQLENYTADHIGFRDSLVKTSKLIAALQGKPDSDSALIVQSDANNTADEQASAAPLPDNTEQIQDLPINTPQAKPALKSSDVEAKGKRMGKVLIVGDRAMNLFSYDGSAGKAYADAINRVQTQLEQAVPYTVHTSVLLAPTAVEFLKSPKLKSLSHSQQKAIDDVYSRLNPGIKKIDALTVMSLHSDEPLYFRTDHHWTALGAYYAYNALIQAAGFSPIPISEYEKGEVPGFLGSLYSSTLNRQLAARSETIVYYKPKVKHRYEVHYTGALQMPLIDLSHAKKKNKYRIFLSGDRPWGLISVENDSDRILLVIKDSYGNALIPFLLPHYCKIYVVDPRQFDQPLVSFVLKHNIHEILYINNSGVLMHQGFSQLLRKLVKL